MKPDALKRFEEVYGEEADRVFRFCIVKVSDREVALDLMQEVFTRLFETMRRGDVIRQPRAWIFAIARNLVIDWYRMKKPVSLERTLESEGRFDELADEEGFRDIELSAEARMLIETFERLDDDFRDVLYFRYVEDLKPSEIASMLGITANLVSVRLTRGMEALRKMLREDGTK